MASFRSHRIIIASLFLPNTISLGDDSQSSTPTHTGPAPNNIPAAAARRLSKSSASASPLGQGPKPPSFMRTFSNAPAPPQAPRSIVQDLTDKSKGQTPRKVVTPAQEDANPFGNAAFSNHLAAAVHALVGSSDPASPGVGHSQGLSDSDTHVPFTRTGKASPGPDRLGPRVSRNKSRSSSRKPPLGSISGESLDRLGRTKWHLETNPHCNGGLRNAVNSVSDRMKRKMWVGVLGTPTDGFDEELRKELDHRMRIESQSLPVWIPDEEFSKCYDGFCHQVLWPCLHYAIPDAPKTKSFYESETFAQYTAVNQKIADTIVANYEEGDLIWVNDYHLMLVPNMIREKLPNACIGFFMHVAFPSSEIFRCLAVRTQLLHGMLAADLIGFQTANFARHFRQTVSRILALESLPKGIQTHTRFVDVAVFPMGIDVKTLTQRRKDPEVAEWVLHLRERYAGLKMIVARDKLDEIAGMRHKIRAYEAFLEANPAFQGKVVLIQVALSTTEENELSAPVVDLVARVNARFGSLTYTPAVFLHTDEMTFGQYLALLTAADTFLVTSLREGMALRAHEFVVCQESQSSTRPAPLILSEFAGSYSYAGFRACLPVNPWDTRGAAQAIKAALTMDDEEARARWRDLYAHVVTQTAQAFVQAFLTRCLRVHMEHENEAAQTDPDAEGDEGEAASGGEGRKGSVPILDLQRILPRYRHATRRLLLIDFEGTLWARDSTKMEVEPPSEVVDVVEALVKEPRNEIWVLSGLPRWEKSPLDVLRRKVPGTGLVAENGCFLKPRGNSQEWISAVAGLNMSWKAPCIEMLQYFTERTPGSVIEEREASIVWRFWTGPATVERQAAGRQWAQRQAAEAQNHIFDSLGEKYGLRIIPGSNAFLVLPNNVSRSTAVGAILSPTPIASSFSPSTPNLLSSSLTAEPLSTSPTTGSSTTSPIYASFTGQRRNPTWMTDADLSFDYGASTFDAETALGRDFVLCVSGDEKLIRRLNELSAGVGAAGGGAETVSCGERGRVGGHGPATEAKWRVGQGEVINVLKGLAAAK